MLTPGTQIAHGFDSGLPVGYANIASSHWAPFAQLVLEASYEATVLAGVLNAARGASKTVLLTRVGGGAFGNDDAWVDSAMRRARRIIAEKDMDLVLVTH